MSLDPQAESWYTGSAIPGKHRQFALHQGGPLVRAHQRNGRERLRGHRHRQSAISAKP